ncbi:MAG: S9 family peptidase, partial [Acidobacteriota bacterium]|nr:S9 family peptidase [Acidobacteriota bacterium]
ATTSPEPPQPRREPPTPTRTTWHLAPVRLFLDGEQVAQRSRSTGGDDNGEAEDEQDGMEPLKAKLSLTPGKHLLLVMAVLEPGNQDSQPLKTTLSAPEGVVTTSLEAQRSLALEDVLDVTTVENLALSADGSHLAVTLTRPAAPSPDSETWVEIRDAEGRVVSTLRGGEGSLVWAPEGLRYGYVVRDEEEADLWIAEVGGETRRVLEDVERFTGYVWMPDGSGLIYGQSDEQEEDERSFKRYRGPNDRWPGWRELGALYHLSLEDPGNGVRRRLTAGGESVSLEDVAPSGEHLLVRKDIYDATSWPFTRADLYEMDLATLEPRKLQRVTWFGSARYSPDGDQILIDAGPSGFGEDGRDTTLGEGPVNEYDSQLYLLDRGTLAVDPISRDFDPSVLTSAWTAAGDVVVHAQDQDRAQLFVYRSAERRFDALETGVDVVQGFAVARQSGAVAYRGSSPQKPERVLLHPGTTDGEAQLLFRLSPERYEDVKLGRVEDWDFDSEEAGTIVGRVYYPPDFDPQKRYPLLVYYYGGALPTDRTFGGRYPKEVWAANGYVVYVLQPSGATGFGQDFSTRHVNDWGITVADEIIEGTRRFLDAHEFVDPERVGCLGASYGGFMTMLLQTRTDLFSAAVAHAGISSIAGYWGQGWWGYLYSAVAAAESYPWNNPELFVGQSPLFAADKINTPLLLLHGDADTNVPPGQSHQLYTALKILGKEVELLTFDGENHRIMDRDRRELWSRAIIAWFDRYLKDQPEYWEHLMGTEEEPKG